jgi:rubrerythrin
MKIQCTNGEISVHDFNQVEALKIARHLEKEGISFYRSLLKVTRDQKVKEVLTYLLSEEEEHLALFEKMLYELERRGEDLLDEDDTLADVVSSGVFPSPGQMQDLDEILRDGERAITLGADMEKRSLMFYLSILKHNEDETGRAAIKKVIAEEERHWEDLKALQ